MKVAKLGPTGIAQLREAIEAFDLDGKPIRLAVDQDANETAIKVKSGEGMWGLPIVEWRHDNPGGRVQVRVIVEASDPNRVDPDRVEEALDRIGLNVGYVETRQRYTRD